MLAQEAAGSSAVVVGGSVEAAKVALVAAIKCKHVYLLAYSGDGGQAFHLKADSDSGRWRTAFR